MPINQAQLLGNWNWDQGKKQHQNWDKASYNILTNDPGFEKLKTKWENVPWDFDIYFVKNKGLRNYLNQGEVTEELLQRIVKNPPEIDYTNITVFFVNNTAVEKMPMTAWTIAHRFGHAISASKPYRDAIAIIEDHLQKIAIKVYKKKPKPYYTSILQPEEVDFPVYEKIQLALMNSFGTMRSARKSQINRSGEFYHELFAQYLLQGTITFNKEIPKQIVTSYAWGNPNRTFSSLVHSNENDLNAIYNGLDNLANRIERAFSNVLNYCVGRIFVM